MILRGDDQCASGLICVENYGRSVGLARTADVCLMPRLQTVDGDFDRVIGHALNDRGQEIVREVTDLNAWGEM